MDYEKEKFKRFFESIPENRREEIGDKMAKLMSGEGTSEQVYTPEITMKQEVKEAIEILKKSDSFLLIARKENGGGSVTLNSDREHQVKLMLTLPIAFYHCKQLIPYIEQAAKIARAYIDELGEEQPKSREDMFGFGKVEENEKLN